MRIRSFVIAYALVLAILLFADRRPDTSSQNRFTRIVDLTESADSAGLQKDSLRATGTPASGTRIIPPAALIPGTWAAGQIPPERLIAPLVVVDLIAVPNGESRITIDDLANWESAHGAIPQGAVVAIRSKAAKKADGAAAKQPMPITSDAAQFLMDARYVLGFTVEADPDLSADRTLAR